MGDLPEITIATIVRPIRKGYLIPLAGGGTLLVGRSQVYIPRVDASWLVPG
jgi:hypothetical protein